MNKNDLEEIQRLAREGDKGAEQKLFEKLTARFLLFARRKVRDESDAREIAQEAVMAVAKEYREIEFKTGFIPWAYKVFEHRLLRYFRSRQRESKNIENLAAETDRRGASVSRINPDLKIRLTGCLKKLVDLHPRYARILNLNHQGFTTDEIRSRMQLTQSNLYSLLSRARSLLKHCLETGEVD